MSDLETCCVCLDALSSDSSCVLLAPTGDACHRVCHHFIHASCAEKLNPRKCPLCRRSFSDLSVPLDQRWLAHTSPEAVLEGLRRLDAAPGPVAARAVVELLAATLPVPEEDLVKAFAEASVSAESLRAALQELGVELREGSEVRAVVRYSLVQRLSWRCRWLLLKACGAFGAGCFWGLAGLAAGICMGGVAAVPSRAWPDVQVGDEPTVLAIIKAAYLCGVLLYYGMQRLDLVLIGLKLGSVLGVAYGFLRGLSVVHPEQHGFRSVFWAGLTGFWRTETHYPREKRVPWPGSS